MSKNDKQIKNGLGNCLLSNGFAFGALVAMFVATIAFVGIIAAAEDIELISINGSYPTFSSDGEKIAYCTDTGICIMDLIDENSNKRLTDRGVVFDWSLDEKQIFYVPYTGAGVRIIKSDGSDDRKIIEDFNPLEDRLILNPDGSKIAYTSNNNIYVMDSDGSNNRLMAKDITQNGTAGIQSCTPDGRIIFTSYDNVNYSIWEIDLDTCTQNKLRTIANQELISIPIISPDGSKMIYGNSIMNIDGSDRRQLNLPYDPFTTRWSPDSRRIAFVIRKAIQQNMSIWMVNADGSGLEKVAKLPEWTSVPLVWSKDGKKIIYAHYKFETLPNKSTDIYIINVGKASPLKAPTDGGASTPSEKQPGFEVVLVIAGLLAVIYFLRKRK